PTFLPADAALWRDLLASRGGQRDRDAEAWRCDGCSAAAPTPSDERFKEAGWVCPACAASRTRLLADDPAAIGGYEVLRAVGRGAMGAVYETRHRETGAHVATKMLLPMSAPDRVVVRRFLKEQRLGLSLVHPHIVRC